MGTDILTGGQGKDDFAFNRKDDSLHGDTSDKVTDFSNDEDRIDWSGMRPDLTFNGTEVCSGTQGEIQVAISGGVKSLIKMDGDGAVYQFTL